VCSWCIVNCWRWRWWIFDTFFTLSCFLEHLNTNWQMLVNRSVLTSIYSNRQHQTNITVFQIFEITQKAEFARERSTIGSACADPWGTRRLHASTQGIFAPTRELSVDPMHRRKGFLRWLPPVWAEPLRRPVSFELTPMVDSKPSNLQKSCD
jgi:hypothetical protein